MTVYITQNGPMPTTVPLAKVPTGTATITLLQIAAPPTQGLEIIRWGVSFDAASGNTSIQVGCLATDQPATVTAHTASGIQPWLDRAAPASRVVLGTISTGYTATIEGTPTRTIYGDIQMVQPNANFSHDFPVGAPFWVPPSYYLRIRCTASQSVGAYCYVVWNER